MEARIAAAKIGKYATSESGDTLEIVERPSGGISCVLVDGQRSGKSAKAISNVVTRKAISLLADGVRDGAVARAASDYLHTYRSGKVLATMNILSIDLSTQSMVITRNNPAPVLLVRDGAITSLDDPSQPVGSKRGIRPTIDQFPLAPGLTAVVYTDGLALAGDRKGERFDVAGCLKSLVDENSADPEVWANRLLETALALDDNRPTDDISVLVASILEGDGDEVRRIALRMPLPNY